MTLSISISKTLKYLFAAMAVLFVLNAAVHVIYEVTGHDNLMGLRRLFDFYSEANMPTFFSTMLLLFAAFLLYLNFHADPQDSDRYYFLALSAVFVFLTLDEFTQLHELVGAITDRTSAASLTPTNKHTWIFWGGSLVLLVGFFFFRFWLRLDKKTRILFFIAGVVYVGGALGFEVAEIFHVAAEGSEAGFNALVAIEESMEMLGVIVLIWGLLFRLEERNPNIQIAVTK